MKSLITAFFLLSLSACTSYHGLGTGSTVWVSQTQNNQEVFYCEKRVNLPPVCAPAAMLDAYPALQQVTLPPASTAPAPVSQEPSSEAEKDDAATEDNAEEGTKRKRRRRRGIF